jgi:hypothetical protein
VAVVALKILLLVLTGLLAVAVRHLVLDLAGLAVQEHQGKALLEVMPIQHKMVVAVAALAQ